MSTNSYALNSFRPFNPFLDDEDSVVDEAIEIRVSWGRQVLKLAHVEAGRGFVLGEGGDFVLPDEMIAGRTPIVEARGSAMVALVPSGVTGTLVSKDGSRVVSGGEEIVLLPDVKLTMTFHVAADATSASPTPVTIEITAVRAGRRAPISFMTSLATSAAASIGLSFLGHAAVVASMAMFMPSMGADDAEALDRDQILAMQKLLTAAAEKEEERAKDQPGSTDDAPGGGSEGGRAAGESGAAGTSVPLKAPGHMAFKGRDDRSQLSRKEELAAATEFGLIGMLRGGVDSAKPASPWADEAKGTDPLDAKGALFGNDIGEAFGTGLALSGVGEGGGCEKGCAGVGIGHIGTVGGAGGGPGKWGIGHGDKDGWGSGHALGKRGHETVTPRLRMPTDLQTNGRLPAEVIQRVVRMNYGRFRVCYEGGLRSNPTLSGRVATKFVIDREGAVSMAQDAGSDLPDAAVTQCIVRSFQALSFPAPKDGIVTVTYPITFAPGDS